ncbi:methyltransferase domain-containing protein [Chloroflexota bacterium]
MKKYVHGYSARETERLYDQSVIVRDLLHRDTAYPPGSRVLEAGCGVGAQTVILAQKSPGAEITSIDISPDSLKQAEALITGRKITNVRFQPADIMALPFKDESFDSVFVCFILEHLEEPIKALIELKRVLKTGGTITVIEGDHGSCFWHPETEESLRVWRSLIESQLHLAHDPLIGRRLYPLLREAGFSVKDVSPRWVYTDGRTPELTDGGINRIMAPMVETAKAQAFALGIIDAPTWDKGIGDLRRVATSADGTLFYTWFKGVAVK